MATKNSGAQLRTDTYWQQFAPDNRYTSSPDASRSPDPQPVGAVTTAPPGAPATAAGPQPAGPGQGGGWTAGGPNDPMRMNWQGGGGGEDTQAVYSELMEGRPLTLESLRAIEPELQRRTGASIEMNARGTAADLRLPNGQFVDVVQGFEGPVEQRKSQWLIEGPGGGGGGAYGGWDGAGLPPGYETGTFTGGGAYPLASVKGPGLMQPWTTPFQAPTLNETTDPGYLARMDLGRQAIERSAAARGTLRTGGTLKDLTQYGQDYGSSEYDKIYGRAMGEYQQAHGIYDRNQSNQFNRLYNLSSLGQNAANRSASQAQQYGSSVADLQTQQGNVRASGRIGEGNAWTQGLATAGNLGMALGARYANRQPPVGGTESVPDPIYAGDARSGGVYA